MIRFSHKSHCLHLLCSGDDLCNTGFFSGRCEYELYILLMPQIHNVTMKRPWKCELVNIWCSSIWMNILVALVETRETNILFLLVHVPWMHHLSGALPVPYVRQCGLHAVRWSHIGVLMQLFVAEPQITGGLLLPFQCLWNGLASPVFNGGDSQVFKA